MCSGHVIHKCEKFTFTRCKKKQLAVDINSSGSSDRRAVMKVATEGIVETKVNAFVKRLPLKDYKSVKAVRVKVKAVQKLYQLQVAK